MNAIIKACSTTISVKNTGKECDTSMVATAMLIALHPSVSFTDTDLLDPVGWMTGLIQQRMAFPLFGNKAPINTISNNAESDILITLDDGTQVFLRYGIYNRLFETISGGLCYAKALQSFNKAGYNFLEIDQEGKMLAHQNENGTYTGLSTTFQYAPSPIMSDFKTTPYKNRFQLSFSPVEIVNFGVIFDGAMGLLSMMGLIDTEIISSGTATATKLIVSVRTECAHANLLTMAFSGVLAAPGNFVITNVLTGAIVVATAAAIVAGKLELTGTFTIGQTYNVKGALPTVWDTAGIEGYDASTLGVNILIP